MKRHSLFAVSCLLAGFAVVLSGCGGCGASNKNVAALSSNWYANTAFKKIQPTFTEGNEGFQKEEITYKVSFDNTLASNKTYSVSYADGVYKTEFYATAFDKSTLAHADYLSSFPAENPVVYCYKTTLEMGEVTFTCNNQSKSFEGDRVETVSYFLPVEHNLQPLYSKQIIKSTTPAELQAGSVDDTYESVDCEYVTYYSYDGALATTYAKVGGENTVKTFNGLDKEPNTVFDTAYLDIVARAGKLNSEFSQVLSLMTPANGVQNFTLKSTSSALADGEKEQIKSALDAAELYKAEYDDEGNELDFATAVSVSYNGTLSGVSQTYWFASVHNAKNNAGRATLLKLSVPLSFGLGTLNYTLEKVENTLWNN